MRQRTGRTVVAAANEHGWIVNPTPELLNAKMAELLTKTEVAAFGFVGEIPYWKPTDSRVTWEQTPTCWQMIFIPEVVVVPKPNTSQEHGFARGRLEAKAKNFAESRYVQPATITTEATSTPTGMPAKVDVDDDGVIFEVGGSEDYKKPTTSR